MWSCDLWRQTPVMANHRLGEMVPPTAMFPSARRSIAQALADAGLSTSSRVGYPSRISACVPRAINLTATARPWSPENLNELDALLVHEPWGWPLAPEALSDLLAHSDSGLLVLDRVDSADFFCRRVDAPGVVEIVSLSKTLGLLGGGLARESGCYRAFTPAAGSSTTTQALGRLASGTAAPLRFREFFKNSAECIHPSVLEWLAANSITAALEHERQARRQMLAAVQCSPLADGWPAWMHAALATGAAPGLAPILRGHDPAVWTTVMRRLAEKLGVACTITVFNWSGDPLAPEYQACLLIPTHGELRDAAAVISVAVAAAE